MKKIFLFVLLILTPIILYSQVKDSVKTYFLGEIVVTAENKAITKAANTVEISGEDIMDRNSFQINESFRSVSGVNLFQNGRNESLIKLRGFDQRQIGMFLDGVPLYISYDGTTDLSQLNSITIGKITISKSMPSILYGTNTLGGSVNIISDEPLNGINTFLNLQYGNQYGGAFKNTGKYKSLYWLLSGNYNKSNGFELPASYSPTKNEDGNKRDNSSFKQKGFNLKTGLTLPGANFINVFFSKYFNSKDVPTNIYTISPRYWRYTIFDNTTANIISDLNIFKELKITTNIYTVNNYNILNSYNDNTFTTQQKNYAFASTYDDYSTGFSILPELSINKIFSAKFALQFKKDTHNEQPNVSQPYKKFALENYSAGIEKNIDINNFDFTGGIITNYLKITEANGNPLRSDLSSVNGHIGIGKDIIGKDFYLYLNASNTTRFPTLKELFSELLGKNIPNPYLSEEKGWNFEIGTKYANERFGNINFSIYYSYVKDMIFQVLVSSNKYQYQNIPKIILSGIEMSYKKPTKYADINFNFNYLYAKNKSDLSSDKLEYKPEFTSNLILSKKYESGFEWQTEIFYTGIRYGIDGDTREWRNLADYTLINLRISKNLFHIVNLFLRADNILDKYYETEYGFPQQGRNFKIGSEIKF